MTPARIVALMTPAQREALTAALCAALREVLEHPPMEAPTNDTPDRTARAVRAPLGGQYELPLQRREQATGDAVDS